MNEQARCDKCGANLNLHGCHLCGAPQCCPQCCQIDRLNHYIKALQVTIKNVQTEREQAKNAFLTCQQQLAAIEREVTRLPGEESLLLAQVIQRDLAQYRKELGAARQQYAASEERRFQLEARLETFRDWERKGK